MAKRVLLIILVLSTMAALTACNGATPATEIPTEAPPTEAPTAVVTEAPTEAATEAPAACTDEWGCAVFEPGQTIKVGYVGPMAGDYAAFGTDISRGAELAVKDHGQIQGFDVELLIEDGQGSPEGGAAVANRLAADPQVVAVDGHTFTGETEAALPIYEAAHIVMMSPSVTRADMTERGSPIFNRVAFSDRIQGQMAADYIFNVLGVTKVAGLHDGSPYGQGLVEGMSAAFEALGGEVVGTEAITPGEADYSAVLNALSALGPELVYFGGYDADGAVVVSQMAGAGLQGVIFFGCDGTYGTNFLNLAGDAAEGAYSTYVPIPPSDAFAQFQADYLADYGEEQGLLSPFSPHSYDAMGILLDAVTQVAYKDGDNLIVPRKALADAVRATTDYAGLTGTLTCSDIGECGAGSPVFMVAEGGVWVEAPGQ